MPGSIPGSPTKMEKQMSLDKFMSSVYPDLQEIHPNRLVSYYCMSSYLYYEKQKNVLSDADYDTLCKRILKEWDNIEHPHKYKLSKEALAAGTGYTMNYTNLIMDAAEKWLKEWEKENGN